MTNFSLYNTSSIYTRIVAPSVNNPTNLVPGGFTANWGIVDRAVKYRIDVSMDDFVTFVGKYHNYLTSSNSLVITGLEGQDPVKYRVRTIGLHNISDYSDDIIFNAVVDTPVAIAPDLGSGQFTAKWLFAYNALEYLLDISSDDFTTFVGSYHNYSVTGGSHMVSGLPPGVLYKYRVRARGVYNTSSYSNIITLPLALAPVATPVSEIGSEGFTANWNLSVGADHYLLDISADSFVTFSGGYHNYVVTGTSFNTSGLASSTNYKYRLRAVDWNHTTGYSNIENAQTETDLFRYNLAANTGSSFLDADANHNNANVIYNPEEESGLVFNYVLTDHNFNDSGVLVNNASLIDDPDPLTPEEESIFFYRLAGAVEETDDFEMVDTTGNSNLATIIIADPLIALPATLVKNTSMQINWQDVGALSYKIDLCETGNGFVTLLPSGSSITVNSPDLSGNPVNSHLVSGLTTGQSYDYRVRYISGNRTMSTNQSGNSNIITTVVQSVYATDILFTSQNIPVWADTSTHISVINLDGSNEKDLTPLPWRINTNALEGFPVYTSDGSAVLFTKRTASTLGADICQRNYNGTGFINLTNTTTDETYAQSVMSPDGTKIACTRFQVSTGMWKLVVMNSDGTGKTTLEGTNILNNIRGQTSDIDWSPDGTKLLFTQHVADGFAIAEYELSSDNISIIVPSGSFEAFSGGRYSADGLSMLFIGIADYTEGDNTGHYEVFTWNFADPPFIYTQVTNVGHGGGVNNLAANVRSADWLPDSTRIVFAFEDVTDYVNSVIYRSLKVVTLSGLAVVNISGSSSTKLYSSPRARYPRLL